MPIQQISGVAHAQLKVRLEGKQVVQIPFQAQIRASQRLVRVVRTAAGFLVDCSFVKELFMLPKPRLQRALKRCLAAVSFRVSVSRHCALPAAVFGLRVR